MVVGLLAFGLSEAAHAGPGDHIRPSDTVTITPRLDVGMEYRTNVYRDEANPTPAASARISPGLSVSAEGPDHQLALGGDLHLRKFVFVGEIPNDVLQRNERLARLDRFNDFAATANADLFKQNVIGLVLNDRISHRNTTTDAEFADLPYNSQFRNELTGGFRISPTSALSLIPGGVWRYDDYRVAPIEGQRYNARTAYGPRLQARWDFFPRTSLLLDTKYVFHRWVENVVSVNGQPTGMMLPNSRHIRGRLGLEGQLTAKLLGSVHLGYGTALYDDTAATLPTEGFTGDAGMDLTGLDGLLAAAQLRYVLSQNSDVFAGYRRDFEDSFFTNYVRYDYLYVGGGLDVQGVRPSVKYGVRLEEYGGIESRSDAFHRVDLGLGYTLGDWASLSTGAGLQARMSNRASVSYQDWNIHLLAKFVY